MLLKQAIILDPVDRISEREGNPGFLSRHFGKKCPKCKLRGNALNYKKEILGREAFTPSTLMTYRGVISRKGVPVIRRDYYICRRCKYMWGESLPTFD